MTDHERKGVYHAPWERSFDRILSPLEEFIHRQTTSGILLMVCAVAALVIANSPLHESYEAFLKTEIGISWGGAEFALSIHYWINEALMVMFFFIIGLELKRELLVGELSSPRQALLPIMAAFGGMAVPAAFYVAFNASGEGLNGWAIPMATDIAFAIGVMSLMGGRVSPSLMTFLIALAIVDDLGAVAVIAIFYTSDIDVTALGYCVLTTAVLVSLNLAGVRRPLPYAAVGTILWGFMLASGIHATIAGIVVAFVIPMRPKFESRLFIERVRGSAQQMEDAIEENDDIIHNSRFRALVASLKEGARLVQAPAQRMENQLHLPVAYLVIPVFALANAGIPIDFADFGQYAQHPITLGVLTGLVLGKPLGVAGFAFLAIKLGLAELPRGLNMLHIIGAGLLAGIGFTMSIFIADLAFDIRPEDLLMAKTGIILASVLAGAIGSVTLLLAGRPRED
jgi:NhaA family Na+:H+ antiporter